MISTNQTSVKMNECTSNANRRSGSDVIVENRSTSKLKGLISQVRSDSLKQTSGNQNEISCPDTQPKPTASLQFSDMSSDSTKKFAQRHPLEFEAETYLMKALENTEDGPNEAQQSILGGAGQVDLKHNFSSDSEKMTIDDPTRVKSTAEDLWRLTGDVMKMQTNLLKHKKSDNFADALGTSEDTLANNASILLQRHRGSKSSIALAAEPEPTFVATNAKSKWKKLRTTMKVTGIANAANSKKNDEETGNMERGVFDFVEDPICAEDDVEKSGRNNSVLNSFPGVQDNTIRKTATSEFHEFESWVSFKKSSLYNYIRILLFLILPATGISSILFYWAGNPPCGTTAECLLSLQNQTTVENGSTNEVGGSYSWWILFVCVRNALLVSLAIMIQAVVVDFLCLRSKLVLNMCGPFLTLYTVQSKGWPFVITWWGILSFLLLYGKNPFANHWLFWQDAIDMFNDANPSGGVTYLASYRTVLIMAIVVGITVSIKRLWVGIYLGRQTFHRHAADLAILMRKILLIGNLSTLAKDIEQYGYRLSDFYMDHQKFQKTVDRERDVTHITSTRSDEDEGEREEELQIGDERVFGMKKDFTGSSMRIKIENLLGAWEEPKEISKKDETVSIGSIIQFRTSLACLRTSLPFSSTYGPASTRQECVDSAETLFRTLLLATPGTYILPFDVIALLAVRSDTSLDEEKVKELIKLFRPDRDGNLNLIDFTKSIDAVYKELRLLHASVRVNSRMDSAFERIVNLLFYFILGCITLSICGVDPLVLFASISGFILGFAFMIGPALAKFFEGLLFILVRRPYDIGDRVHVSDPNIDTQSTGSSGWFVRDVTLFTTTVCFATTNEVATLSNGSLASSRIINHARSPEASVFILLKFPISASQGKLQVFSKALEHFVKCRPREYLSFSGFRCVRVETDSGFMEYIVIVTHREPWQNLLPILASKAELSSFALELSKKMNLRYKSPPRPVDLQVGEETRKAFGMKETNDFTGNTFMSDDGAMMPTEGDLDDVHALFTRKLE